MARAGGLAGSRVRSALVTLALVGLWSWWLVGCRESAKRSDTRLVADAAPPWRPAQRVEPTPPSGMVWIPMGELVAGTPPGRVPRVADEEMPGTKLTLGGFFIDVFAYPNEEGAIPRTGTSHAESGQLCAEQGKRLCTELEWERACKGPQNFTYEYGDRYRPRLCSTGGASRMLPSGLRFGCRSEFGVRDLHGSIGEWTASRWGRGDGRELYALRGGNGADGELVGRCANATARHPTRRSADVGFRCCKGPQNEARVAFAIESGPALRARRRDMAETAQALLGVLPDDAKRALSEFGDLQIDRVWDWRPIGNVQLVVGGGCAGERPRRRCGVVIAEPPPGRGRTLAFAWSGKFAPVARIKGGARRLWIYGGDRQGSYRRPAVYEWGRVRLGEVERKLRE